MYHIAIIAAAFTIALSTGLKAEPLAVIDGDGFRLPSGENVRLWGIDAPELSQTCERDGQFFACGEVAKKVLQTFLAAAAPPKCEAINKDRYGRLVARCKVGSDDLGELMVRSGWAVDYERYSDGAYAAAEAAAKAARRGVWEGEFVAPWEHRKLRR